MRPATGFARNGDLRIAYQVSGKGPLDLIVSPGYVSHVDMWWMMPESARFVERLGSFARLIVYDKRGTGLSDPSPGIPSTEERMEDLHAVLDAVGSERAALFGYSEGGPLSMLFAATYPERTAALVLFGTFARWPAADYFPEHLWRVTELEKEFADIHEHWGEGRLIDLFAPDLAGDPITRQQFALYERLSASPATAAALLDAAREIDVRHVLSAISAPTLVMHRVDEATPLALARDIARSIPGAQLAELEGSSHIPFLGETEPLLDTLEEFLTGAHVEHVPQRALVTVLFTDIVDSTGIAGRIGDAQWRTLLQAHDALIAREVHLAGGTVVKSLGDGAFARFDSPARAIRAARRIVVEAPDHLDLQIRAGVHTGECEILGDDLGGLAVHVGARIAGLAQGGEVLASGAVRDLVLGSALEFAERGRHQLKGVPGEWTLVAAVGEAPAPSRAAPPRFSNVAPNAPLATRADLAAAHLASAVARRPGMGRPVWRAARWGMRLRRNPGTS